MKRSLLVISLVLLIAAPSFAQVDFAAANAVALPCFGWGVCVPGCGVLLGIGGDDYPGSQANIRAAIIAARLADLAEELAAGCCGQIFLAKVCGSDDYKIVLEICDEGEVKCIDLVTIDNRTAKPYGACAKQLGTFWLKRLKGCIMAAQGVPCICWPKDIAAARGANWRCWKGACTITVPCQ